MRFIALLGGLCDVDCALFGRSLASRSLAAWLRDEVHPAGYESHLLFLWLPSVEVAIARVEARVRLGGHGVPADTVRRRYALGIRNFHQLYAPVVRTWRVYDNEAETSPSLVASGGRDRATAVRQAAAWERFVQQTEVT